MSPENKKGDSTGSARFINRLNKIRILDLVRNTENLSRADIAKTSGLSAPTVSRIVEALMREGFIREVGEGVSQGGRRPTLLKFSEQGNFIVGVDLGTTHIYGVLSDFEGKIAAEIRRPTHVEQGFASVMKRTSEVIEELRAYPLGREKRIYGIGLAVAGLINRSRNIVEFSPDFHWHNVDVVEALAPAHDLPIIFDNVTRVMALGEMWYGLGKQYRNLICVNVGYGIGAGIIIDGKPLLGRQGMAGEFGHVTLDKDSRVLCECGNRGCIEALASGNAIARSARARLAEAGPGILRDYCGGDPAKLTTEMVANAAQRGDRLAFEIFDTAVEYLGIGIAGLINVFNPEAVIIGGGVAQAGSILFDKIRQTVNSRALNKIASGVVIRPATFGIRAAVMGAVSLVLSDVLSLSGGN
jgi:glucokinase-like ROK family protein